SALGRLPARVRTRVARRSHRRPRRLRLLNALEVDGCWTAHRGDTDGGWGLARRRPIRRSDMTSSAERALLMGERRLQAILDSAHAAFVALDAEGLIVNWNN